MIFYGLVAISIAMTFLLFMAREPLLGFPSLMFWAILGGYCYQQFSTVWDIYYLLFFASIGMSIFTGYAAFAIRKSSLSAPKSDLLESGSFIDEDNSKSSKGFMETSKEESAGREMYIDEDSSPSRRSQALHQRAAERRTGGRPFFRKWGEFR